MPIYEYQCQACGHQLEIIQKATDEPVTTCPACHANQLAKQISATSFQLKGSGWYATDYKSKANASPADNKNNDATDSSGGSTQAV